MKRLTAFLTAALLVFCLSGPAFAQTATAQQPAEVFELPVAGASGYAAVELTLYGPGEDGPIGTLKAGTGFTILRESNQWWQVRLEDETIGWVLHSSCLINLPDVIPSIVYDNTNTYGSRLKAVGKDITGVTGAALYKAKDYNGRLGKEQYIVPAMYGMAPKIAAAQKAALAENNTLVIYEAFRSTEAHNVVYNSLTKLVASDKEVYNGMTGNSFTMGWFLAPAPYNHQRGTAIDVSLAKVVRTETKTVGSYGYTEVAEHTEYPMQTPIHELSLKSTIYTNINSVTLMPNVTEGSKLLQKYCVAAGLSPLASEWWHFNDVAETNESIALGVTGGFSTEASFSVVPAI
jgi:D-alanyl-D-alanine dipeptidase